MKGGDCGLVHLPCGMWYQHEQQSGHVSCSKSFPPACDDALLQCAYNGVSVASVSCTQTRVQRIPSRYIPCEAVFHTGFQPGWSQLPHTQGAIPRSASTAAVVPTCRWLEGCSRGEVAPRRPVKSGRSQLGTMHILQWTILRTPSSDSPSRVRKHLRHVVLVKQILNYMCTLPLMTVVASGNLKCY